MKTALLAIGFILSSVFYCSTSYSQVTASFTAPDTVLVNAPVQVSNTSIGASTYYWAFCENNFTSPPTATDLGNPNGELSYPVYSALVKDDNGNYFGFVVNNYPGGLVRLAFGSSPLNIPSIENLGNLGVIPTTAEGIQIVKVNGNWIAIIVGGDPLNGTPSVILKLDFGTSLSSIPLVLNWGNIGDLAFPVDLYLFTTDNKWYGYTVNFRSNTLTKFDFGSDFTSVPTGTNLGNLGSLNEPVGIGVINNAGNWHLFITNDIGNTLTRLDFGASLLNAPVATNIGNPNNLLDIPRDLAFIKLCDGVQALCVNAGNNTITKLNFGNDLLASPVGTSMGNPGNLNFPHSLSEFFRVDNDIYTLIPNVYTNSFTRLKFAGCGGVASSTEQNPASFRYPEPGIYNINLLVDIGLPTQSSFCKKIVVKSSIDLAKGLVAYYPFSGNANDESGNGNNPVFNNATLTADRSGNPNSAYYFNGVDNYMQIPNAASINPSNQISLSVLIKPMGFYYGPCHGNRIIMKGDADYLTGNYLLTYDDNFSTGGQNCFIKLPDTLHQTYYGMSTSTPLNEPPFVQKDTWQSLTYTYDGSNAKLYLNCKLVFDNAVSGLSFSNSFDLFFGKMNHPLFPYWFNGVLDEVRIYDRAINELEVQALCGTANKFPTVNLTTPGNDTTYTVYGYTKITLNANASDTDGTISKVAFYNNNILLHTEYVAPYGYIWQNVPAGNYTITAKATDNDGNVTTSNPVHISVVRDKAPTVNITSPVNGAAYLPYSSIFLSADANDVDGTIKKVDFYNGSKLIFTEYLTPFERKGYRLPIGNYSITAKATDNNGRATTSVPVQISVVKNLECTLETQPTFGFNFNGTNVVNINNGIADPSESASVTVCDGGEYFTSGHFHSSLSNLYNITTKSSGSTLLFNGHQAGDGVITAAQLTGTAGTWTISLVNPEIAGTLVQTITPFTDLNNSGTLDAGDCVGDPIVFTHTATPKPTFGFNFNGTNVANINNGIADPSESASVTVCNGGEYFTSGHFHSSLSNLYNITYASSGSTLLFNGYEVGNLVITADQLTATAGIYTIGLTNPEIEGTLIQTITPFTDLNNSGALDAGDCVGDPIVFTYTATPCTNNTVPIASSRLSIKNTKTGINEVVRLKLIPNPVNTILNIYATGLQRNKQTTISVISTSGVVLQTKRMMGTPNTTQLNVASLVSGGVYFIKITNGDKVLYKQFVKL